MVRGRCRRSSSGSASSASASPRNASPSAPYARSAARASALTSRWASSPSSTGRKRGLRSLAHRPRHLDEGRAPALGEPQQRVLEDRVTVARDRPRRATWRRRVAAQRRAPQRVPHRTHPRAASHAPHRRRGPHERPLGPRPWPEQRLDRPDAVARAQRRGGTSGSASRSSRSATGRVGAPLAREAQRLQHHRLRRVVEDQRRHQPRAALGHHPRFELPGTAELRQQRRFLNVRQPPREH